MTSPKREKSDHKVTKLAHVETVTREIENDGTSEETVKKDQQGAYALNLFKGVVLSEPSETVKIASGNSYTPPGLK